MTQWVQGSKGDNLSKLAKVKERREWWQTAAECRAQRPRKKQKQCEQTRLLNSESGPRACCLFPAARRHRAVTGVNYGHKVLRVLAVNHHLKRKPCGPLDGVLPPRQELYSEDTGPLEFTRNWGRWRERAEDQRRRPHFTHVLTWVAHDGNTLFPQHMLT